jgi:hypothetical protein
VTTPILLFQRAAWDVPFVVMALTDFDRHFLKSIGILADIEADWRLEA